MNNYSLRCLRLKGSSMTYQCSKKYITVMKSLDTSIRRRETDQCLEKHFGQRLYHSDLVQCSRSVSIIRQHQQTDGQNTITNCEGPSIKQTASLMVTKGMAVKLGQVHKSTGDCDNHTNNKDLKGSDSQIFEEIKDRSQTSGNPTQCKFQKFNSQSCKCFFPMPSHNKLWRTSQQQNTCRSRCMGSPTQKDCSRLFSSLAHSGAEFVVRPEPPWRVLFFGTDQISVETLKRLHGNMHSSCPVVESLEVVSNVEKREVRAYAEQQGLNIYDWPVPVMPNKYDVGVLVSFGHLIPDDIIHMFPYGILNMHPSLLPRWRGASPIIHTILNGDTETGISVMEIRPRRFDVGPVLMQRRVPVPPRCTSLQLSSILAPLGADMVIEALSDLRKLERFEEEQNTEGIRYAHKLRRENANIDWETQTCTEIDQQFRAISEMMPLKSRWKDRVAKFYDMVDPSLLAHRVDPSLTRGYSGDITKAVPGTPAYYYKLDCLLIKCKDGVVGFKNVSVKKRMTAMQFMCGYLAPPDDSVFESLENDLNKYVRKKWIKQRVKA